METLEKKTVTMGMVAFVRNIIIEIKIRLELSWSSLCKVLLYTTRWFLLTLTDRRRTQRVIIKTYYFKYTQ